MTRTRRPDLAELPAPRLLYAGERDGWVLLCFEEAPGRVPHEPWTPAELRAALDLLTALADQLTPAPPTGIIDADGTARLVDRGRACAGPAWTDLACLLLEFEPRAAPARAAKAVTAGHVELVGRPMG